MQNYSSKAGIIVITLISLWFIAACDGSSKGKNRKSPITTVSVSQIQNVSLTQEQVISGTLEANSHVRIYNQEAAKIETINVYPGDKVDERQLIASLDDRLLKRNLEKAEASYKQAKLDLNRLTRLVPRKLTSENELARARTQLEQAKAEANLFKTRLSFSQIRSPINGVVTARLREPGDVVPLHTHILSVADISSLKVNLSVSELLITSLRKDMKVKLRIDALGDNLYEATIARVYPIIDTSSRQGTVEIVLNDVPEGAIPGQLARVKLKARLAKRDILPAIAVRNDSLGEFVYRVNNKSLAEKIRVQTGIQIGNNIEILTGVNPDDRIITKGFQKVSDGIKVKIQDNNNPANTHSLQKK